MTPKELVLTATSRLFTTRDPAVFDLYWAPNYVQHSALAPDGVEGGKAFTRQLPPTFRYELARCIAQGELVVTHGTYFGLGPVPLVAMDLWRVEGGRIAEHWDSIAPRVEKTASGRSMTDGPGAATDLPSTAVNRALVERFVDTVAIGGDFSSFQSFFAGDAYAQHNPLIRDTVKGLMGDFAALAAAGKGLQLQRRYRTVAEGNLVFVQSSGLVGKSPAALYDLWRVEDGKLAEHWDVVSEVPAKVPHSNGLF
jgi:predicted SnoaL-like aldol condensation-catalyzing enzyme